MRNLLALAALLVILFLVVGYFQQWYAIEETTAADGQKSYRVVFFTKKIQEDVKKETQEVGEMLNKK
jgi:hypothetical protein